MIMKEVGSVFPLDTLEISPFTKYTIDEFKDFLGLNESVLFLSLGRESFSIIARNHSQVKRVLLPTYTCQTVCDPFVELGWDIDTYLIDEKLRIDSQDLRERVNDFKPAVLVVHPFYGTTFNQEEITVLEEVKKQGVIVVADYTQSVYCKEHLHSADYIVASLRKWFDCPDGGYIFSTCHDLSAYSSLSEYTDFIIPQRESMYLRNFYFKTGNQNLKEISIRLNKQAVRGVEKNIYPHSLSDFGLNRLLNSSVEEFGRIRFKNYNYLYRCINQNEKIRFIYNNLDELVSAPLYFPIFCENRSELQEQLALNKIYAPVLWPVPEYYKILNNLSLYIYNHILAIPIDQRYGSSEMKRICDVINDFSKNN